MTRRTFMEMMGSMAFAAALPLPSPAGRRSNASAADAASGIGRKPKVVRVYDQRAVSWDYSSAQYLDGICQEPIEKMVSRGLLRLTGEREPRNAWRKLIPHYKSEDRIALKPNFNAVHLDPPGLIPSPQLIRAVISGLLEAFEISESEIYLYDLCKRIPTGIKDRIGYRINYVERRSDSVLAGKVAARMGWGLESADKSAPIHMRAKIRDSEGKVVNCYIPKVVTYCEHLINLSILSDHPYLAISGPLKNHFGTVRFSNFNSFPVVLHGGALESSIVDINMNPHLFIRTRLLLCDALIGQFARDEMGFRHKWKSLDSEEGSPCSVFFATDPVALESVLLHFVTRERRRRGLEVKSHDYLHVAAGEGLGIHEDLDDLDRARQITYEVA